MKNPSSPNNAYQIAVIYTGDGNTTAVNLKIMTLDGSNLVVGHDFTIPLHRVDLLVDQVRQQTPEREPPPGQPLPHPTRNQVRPDADVAERKHQRYLVHLVPPEQCFQRRRARVELHAAVAADRRMRRLGGARPGVLHRGEV